MINEVLLVGRAGKDAEVVHFQSGNKCLKVSVATWVNVRDETHESGWRNITQWHNVVMWGDYVDKLAPRITKGCMVAVKGNLQYSQYEKDGETKYITEVIGNVSPIHAPKAKETTEQKPPEPKQYNSITDPRELDDITKSPF